jgi:hypothetical protein
MRFARPQQLIGIRECGAWVFVWGHTLRKDMPTVRLRAQGRCKQQSCAVTKCQATRQVTTFQWVSEQAAIISLCSLNVSETKCVYCAVRAESLNVFQFVFCRLSPACPLYIWRCSVLTTCLSTWNTARNLQQNFMKFGIDEFQRTPFLQLINCWYYTTVRDNSHEEWHNLPGWNLASVSLNIGVKVQTYRPILYPIHIFFY